jgi:aromatic ring-opening dioxygenase catalytic subunit (LigB family)
MNMAVKGWDVNSDSAIATVMVSINNYINSPEFIVEMGNKLVKALDEDANYPAILVE